MTRHPPLTITAVIAVLAVVALPALHLTQGLPDAGSNPKSDTQRRAYDLLSRGFGPGFNGTLTVVVDASAHPQLHGVGKAAAHSLRSFPDVASVSPSTPNADRQVWIVTLTPNSAPASQATSNLVALIRQRAAQASHRYGVKAYITGATAFNIDTSNTLSSALPVYLVLVVGLALVLLMVVFRSLLVPLTAVLGFLLTIVATLGVVVFVFQQGHLGSLFGVQSKASIISFLPILVAAILFGLAMDYQVFLVDASARTTSTPATPPTQ